MFSPNRDDEILYRSASFVLTYARLFRHVIDTVIFSNRKAQNGSILLFLYLLTCLIAPSHAEQNSNFSISLWPISERLSQGTIRSTIDGKDGMLWIAALDGINRFDGNSIFEFRTYKTNEGFIESSNMLAIVEGESGEIFASTRDAGILVYNEQLNSFISLQWNETDPTLDENISAVFSDSNSVLWVGYENGQISRINYRLEAVTHFQPPTSARITDFTKSSSGNILASTSLGELYQFESNHTTPNRINLASECQSKLSNLIAISAVADNKIWGGTRGHGLYLIDINNASCSKFNLPNEAKLNSGNANINSIFHEPQRRLTWIASDQGLYRIDGEGASTHFHAGNSSLASNEVLSISSGKNGVYWIGTYSGLNYLVPTEFDSFGTDGHKDLHSIVAIDSSPQYGTWIASYDGLFNFDPAQNTHFKLVESHPDLKFTNEKIMSLHIDLNGVWVGYRSTGLEFYSVEKGELASFGTTKRKKLSSDSVSAIFTASNGETLVGTYGGGLNIVSREGNIVFQSGTANRVIMLYETSDKSIWIGTESTLYRMDLDSREMVAIDVSSNHLSSKTKPVIWSMAESPNGDLWFGTIYHGLFFWQKEHLAIGDSTKIERMLDDSTSFHTIYAIQVDSLENAWFSSNQGLAKIDHSTRDVTFYSRHYGLQNSEYDFGVSHKDSLGRLYFGGSNGYIRFDPSTLNIAAPSPKIRLTNIALSQAQAISPHALEQLQALQLTHKDYFVVFTFSVMDFLDPEKNQYRYMLENFDPDWIDNGTRNTATYTNLPAGDYVFRVQGANSAGVWNREGISLIVRVLPPPWHTWWAYCLYGVGFLFFLWIFKRVYDSYVIKKRAIEMAIQMHETENRADDDMQEQLEQQDDLVKSVYRHNVATLALVSDYISRQSDYLPDDIAREATEGSIKRVAALSALEDCLYYQNDGLLADLHKYTDILISKLVSDASVRPDTIISINDVSTKLIAAEIASPLSIALYELLENCFQHAFELESPANYIHISLDIEPTDSPLDRCYRLVVRDNGVGCPGNIHPDTPETSGFATVHAIAEKLSGSLHISSDNGTTVTIVFVQTMPE
jgi:ligand-binding sensor domain-containing protein/two-component sensor histidine kinase